MDSCRFIVVSRIINLMNILRISGAAALFVAALSAAGSAQNEKQGTTYKSPNGATLKLMLDDSNVGPEVTVGELTFPPNTDSGDHAHGAIEMFYVLSGELERVVNFAFRGIARASSTRGFDRCCVSDLIPVPA